MQFHYIKQATNDAMIIDCFPDTANKWQFAGSANTISFRTQALFGRGERQEPRSTTKRKFMLRM
ncbi:hypothetical protein QG37_00420 [Candidozyma auris]|uniref:Uncharacterized protein n=1 Tax=Candidozyma auris TaxID=498019 RepID=A0A0L0P9C8_CANAR|nr:hypothetical protein QG37_00420 [[Candida] auris]